jgi:hypothetical protein
VRLCAVLRRSWLLNGHPNSETRLVEDDGRLIIRLRGTESSEREATLSSDDLAQVTTVIESEAFEQGMTDGFGCTDATSEERFDLTALRPQHLQLG